MSCNFSSCKGAWSDYNVFTVDGEQISLLVEEPVRSFARLYPADLFDKHMASAIITQPLYSLQIN